ncbi:hypothetical protein BDZ89DRAFT_1124593 [Hymenopellis radicata]|nr:hypothetical protein BDZ89DRAFT_1124593 [Hymenopellis radicata]
MCNATGNDVRSASPLNREIKALTLTSVPSFDAASVSHLLRYCAPSEITFEKCDVSAALPLHVFNRESIILDDCEVFECVLDLMFSLADSLKKLELTALRSMVYGPRRSSSAPLCSLQKLSIIHFPPENLLPRHAPIFLMLHSLYPQLVQTCAALTMLRLWFNMEDLYEVQRLINAAANTLQVIGLHVVDDSHQQGLTLGVNLAEAFGLRDIECGCYSTSLLFLHKTLSSVIMSPDLHTVQLWMDHMFVSQERAETAQRDIQRFVDHGPHSFVVTLDDFDVSDFNDVLNILTFVSIAGVDTTWISPNIYIRIIYGDLDGRKDPYECFRPIQYLDVDDGVVLMAIAVEKQGRCGEAHQARQSPKHPTPSLTPSSSKRTTWSVNSAVTDLASEAVDNRPMHSWLNVAWNVDKQSKATIFFIGPEHFAKGVQFSLYQSRNASDSSDFGGFESSEIAILAAKIRGFEAKMVKSPADFADLRESAGVHTKFWHHAMLEFRGILLSSCT